MCAVLSPEDPLCRLKSLDDPCRKQATTEIERILRRPRPQRWRPAAASALITGASISDAELAQFVTNHGMRSLPKAQEGKAAWNYSRNRDFVMSTLVGKDTVAFDDTRALSVRALPAATAARAWVPCVGAVGGCRGCCVATAESRAFHDSQCYFPQTHVLKQLGSCSRESDCSTRDGCLSLLCLAHSGLTFPTIPSALLLPPPPTPATNPLQTHLTTGAREPPPVRLPRLVHCHRRQGRAAAADRQPRCLPGRLPHWQGVI